MQIIKYMGIILLSGSVSCFGVILSSRLKQVYRLRTEVISLLKDIERGIIHGRIPVSVILRDFPDGKLRQTGFCQRIMKLQNPYSAVEESLAIFSDEDKKMLVGFFSQLGKSGSSECERQNCRYIIDYFEKTQPVSEGEITEKASLYRKISATFALLTAIILI